MGMTMYESKVPERIERYQIVEAMEVLGIDAGSVCRVCIDSKTVTIEAFLRDEEGRRRLAPKSELGESNGYLKAREVIHIGPDRAWRADRIFMKAGQL